MSGGSTTWSSTLTSTRSSSCMAPSVRPPPFPDTRVGDHCIVGAVTPQARGGQGAGAVGAPGASGTPRGSGAPSMALEGLRILDFTRLGFGAQATLICGCLGAEVIRVESTRFPDAIRVMPPFVPEPGERGEAFGAATLANATGAPSANRGGIFYKYNTGGKKSITVNARHPQGLALLKDLVAESDVVTESFAAGHLGPVGALLRHHARHQTRHHLRLDVRVRTRGPRHVARHHGPHRPGPHGRDLHGRPSRPPPGGMVVLLPRPRGRLSRGHRRAGRRHPPRPHRRGTAHRRLATRARHGLVGGAAARRHAQRPTQPPARLPHRQPT